VYVPRLDIARWEPYEDDLLILMQLIGTPLYALRQAEGLCGLPRLVADERY
jgi:hypothetical protein